MTDYQSKNIQNLLKTHYGVSKVVVDNHLLFVYGGNVDSVYTAVVVEYGDEYDIVYEMRNEDSKEVVLRLVKKSTKVVDTSKTIR